jgi:transposase-like protein
MEDGCDQRKSPGSHEIEICQNKYLNNRVEQDHRVVKRIVRVMLGFMSFRAASITLRGIEPVHMLKKGQMNAGNSQGLTAAEQFYSLTA